MDLIKEFIKKDDNILLLNYTNDLIDFIKINSFLNSKDKIYSSNIDNKEIPNYLLAICSLEKINNEDVIWRVVFSSKIFDKPLVSLNDNFILVKYGFRIHALNQNNGLHLWFYESESPIINFYIDKSYLNLAVISDDKIVFLNNNGKLLEQYSHSELILESFLRDEDICFIDFSKALWKISLNDKKVYRIS